MPVADRRRAWLRLGALAAGLAAALAIVAFSSGFSARGVRDWVDGFGVAAPLVFIAVSAALTCALFPSPVLAGASGLLFGTALGFTRRGFLSVLYARIVPGMPYTLVNYAAGLTRIPLAVFAAATALGAAPRAFAYTALGGSLGNLGSPETLVAVAVLIGMALMGIALLARERRRAA